MTPLMGLKMAIIHQRVTKSLYKSFMSIYELGQWTSDQVGRRSRAVSHESNSKDSKRS